MERVAYDGSTTILNPANYNIDEPDFKVSQCSSSYIHKYIQQLVTAMTLVLQ